MYWDPPTKNLVQPLNLFGNFASETMIRTRVFKGRDVPLSLCPRTKLCTYRKKTKKQGKDILKKEKDILKQERMFLLTRKAHSKTRKDVSKQEIIGKKIVLDFDRKIVILIILSCVPSRILTGCPVPWQDFELVTLSLCPGTIKERLSLCPEKLHYPILL